MYGLHFKMKLKMQSWDNDMLILGLWYLQVTVNACRPLFLTEGQKWILFFILFDQRNHVNLTWYDALNQVTIYMSFVTTKKLFLSDTHPYGQNDPPQSLGSPHLQHAKENSPTVTIVVSWHWIPFSNQCFSKRVQTLQFQSKYTQYFWMKILQRPRFINITFLYDTGIVID